MEHSDPFAASDERVDRFGRGTGAGPHQNDDALGIERAVVFDESIVSSGRVAETSERALDDAWHREHVGVRGLARLEEDVGVLRAAAQYRTVGVEAPQSMRHDPVVVDQPRDRVGVGDLDPPDLVARAETVEEVQERDTRLEC